ncbi:MAG: RNA repair domain-containing protein [Caldisphaeraceae archaeon]|nr:RNA repair domain-containing protein [Caldisphaeraceae archaeon]
MGKRRGALRDILYRAVYAREECLIYYIDRSPEHGARELYISSSKVIAVSNWAITLEDNETTIPLHRITKVTDRDGRVLWRKVQ